MGLIKISILGSSSRPLTRCSTSIRVLHICYVFANKKERIKTLFASQLYYLFVQSHQMVYARIENRIQLQREPHQPFLKILYPIQ